VSSPAPSTPYYPGSHPDLTSGHFVVDKTFFNSKTWRVTDGGWRITDGHWRVTIWIYGLHQTMK
jgi:hypothetical protein